MSADEREDLVERFLARREREPDLDPEAFAGEHAARDPGLLAALDSALEVESELCVAGQLSSEGGESIGPYRVLRTLGHGGMGVVYEVEREGARFALKRMHPALATPRASERFRREARLLAGLDHPGIVRVEEVGSTASEPYLVLELVEGRSLLDAAAGMDRSARLRTVVELCDAVDAVHRAGFLHRDLKPQNVLVRRGGRCVLVDFGLGSAKDDPTLTSSGDLLGTPRYMAPEQALGREADARTDVWGLGQILFELLTGRAAVEEGSRAEVLRAVADGRLHRPRRIAPDLPAALETILLVALARDPRRRYASARELGADLERVLRGEPIEARPPGPLVRLGEAARRRPVRAAVGLTLAAVLLVALPFGFAQRRAEAGARHSRARVHLDRALIAWTHGEEEPARREVDAALALDALDAGVALRDLLDGAPLSEGPGWSAALTALAVGESDEAAELFAGLDARDARATVLEARALRLAGDVEGAARRLESADAESALAAAERFELARAQGDTRAALREIERAVALDPEDLRLRRDLALAHLEAGETRAGVDAAHGAAELGERRGEAGPAELARLLRRAPDLPAVRVELTERLSRGPWNPQTHFALAVLLDAAHDVRSAAESYADLIGRDPSHGLALAYLSNLRAGADVGRCDDCDEVFAREHDLIDREEAGALLARAARADRGRDEDLLRAIVYIAREHELTVPVAAALDEVLASDHAPLARPRLQEALEGLRRGE